MYQAMLVYDGVSLLQKTKKKNVLISFSFIMTFFFVTSIASA